MKGPVDVISVNDSEVLRPLVPLLAPVVALNHGANMLETLSPQHRVGGRVVARSRMTDAFRRHRADDEHAVRQCVARTDRDTATPPTAGPR